jgi:hypothetical protein
MFVGSPYENGRGMVKYSPQIEEADENYFTENASASAENGGRGRLVDPTLQFVR